VRAVCLRLLPDALLHQLREWQASTPAGINLKLYAGAAVMGNRHLSVMPPSVSAELIRMTMAHSELESLCCLPVADSPDGHFNALRVAASCLRRSPLFDLAFNKHTPWSHQEAVLGLLETPPNFQLYLLFLHPFYTSSFYRSAPLWREFGCSPDLMIRWACNMEQLPFAQMVSALSNLHPEGGNGRMLRRAYRVAPARFAASLVTAYFMVQDQPPLVALKTITLLEQCGLAQQTQTELGPLVFRLVREVSMMSAD
jgi:hypothetical protein